MGPCLSTPVITSCFFTCTGVLSPCSPIQKPSTPPRVSVGVSPIRVQKTPTRTFVSRGQSPVPLENLLPPDLASFFAGIETQTTQHLSPTQLEEVISVTESESDDEYPLSRSKIRAYSPDVVPETQVKSDEELPVCLHLLLKHVVSQSGLRWTGSLIRYSSRSAGSFKGYTYIRLCVVMTRCSYKACTIP